MGDERERGQRGRERERGGERVESRWGPTSPPIRVGRELPWSVNP